MFLETFAKWTRVAAVISFKERLLPSRLFSAKKKEIKFKFFNVTLGNLHDDYDDDNKSLALP